MTVAIFTVTWLAIFGPKLAGFADLSLVAGVIGFLLLARFDALRISQEYVAVTVLTVAVLAYSVLAVLLDGANDLQPVLRHVRSILSSILLGLFFYNIAISRIYSSAAFLKVLTAVLLTNALVVLVSVFQLQVQEVLAGVYGFDKGVRPLRSFGLTAGYDTAGYLCAAGALISSVSIYYWKSKFDVFSLVVFIAGALFTSRSSMLLAFSLVAVLCLVFLVRGRWTLKALSVIYLVSAVYIGLLYIIPLVKSSFGLGGVLASDKDFSGSFATTDLSAWVSKMWTLPDTTVEVIFGTGMVIQSSDVGYIELIYMIGLLGLFLVLSLYGYMFVVAARMKLAARGGEWTPDVETWVLLTSLTIILLGMLVINIKNLYFLSRGFHELIIIIFFFSVGTRRAAEYRDDEEQHHTPLVVSPLSR